MTIVVFLGPTMPVSTAEQILPDAIYRPPAAQSDILSAVDRYQPQAIALIDGVFTQSLSVWHKEILYALERGVAVYGASSMGALRVAETSLFGAVGVGTIYEAYASGELTDDDEVAVAHTTSEWEYRSLSVAMVNIRATLEQARTLGVIDDAEHAELIAAGKQIFFPERTYASLLAVAAERGVPAETIERLRAFVEHNAVDAKFNDAVALLEHLRDNGVTPPPPVEVTRSHPFLAMYHRDRIVERASGAVSLADISSYAALHLRDFAEVNEHALHASLVDVLAELLGVAPDEAAIAVERDRFRIDRRLRSEEDLRAWLADNDLNDEDFERLLTSLATRRMLRDWYISRKYLERTTEDVLTELRLRGRYPQAADGAAAQQEIIASAYPDFEHRGDDAELVDLIKEHARATGWRPTVDLSAWAFENGFKDLYDVRFELVRAKLARSATNRALESLTDRTSQAGAGD